MVYQEKRADLILVGSLEAYQRDPFLYIWDGQHVVCMGWGLILCSIPSLCTDMQYLQKGLYDSLDTSWVGRFQHSPHALQFAHTTKT